MRITIKASTSKPPLAVAIAAKSVAKEADVVWGNHATSLDLGGGVVLTSETAILRHLCRSTSAGLDALTRTEIDHWITFSAGPLACASAFADAVAYLDSVLAPDAILKSPERSFLVGAAISAADFAVYAALWLSPFWQGVLCNKATAPVHALKWFERVGQVKEVAGAVSSLPKDAKPKPATMSSKVKASKENKAPNGATNPTNAKPKQTKDEGKFVDLPGAELGKVIVRFPPEASGFLHIGHAKAVLLNQYYQQNFQGKLILRFDDTNPAKEKEEFEHVILQDLKLLQVKYDHFSRTSDHFETMLNYCQKMIKEGKAYVDNTDAETMKAQREAREESANRSNSVDVNLKLWEEMKKGTDKGLTCAVRAKIDMKSDNGCLRDPTIYRCKPESHPATGNKYKVYPTYDFACPIVDSIEGVTHALRTTEYMDRDQQYFWFIDALGLRKPHIYAYSRLSMTNTVMSKRKLTYLVDEGFVDGWDDPRMPTVCGVIRRGLTVEALKQFIVAQGSSRSVVFMEWDKIWSINKKVIDPIAPRFTCVDKTYNVRVNIKGAKEESTQADKHPKEPAVGKKTVWTAPKVLIDGADADVLKEGENATFINWGNVMITKVNKANGKVTSVDANLNLENKDFKKTPKVTWLAETTKAPFTPAVFVYYDHVITKPVLDKDDDFKKFIGQDTKSEVEMLGDPELKSLKKGDVVQVQRKGFFIVDSPVAAAADGKAVQPVKLIAIPDGTPGSYGKK